MQETQKPTQNDQDAAFEAFYDLNADQLYRSVLFRVRDGNLASDIIQESCVRLYQRWETYDNDDHRLRTVYTIARNLIMDHYRKRKHASIDDTHLSETLASTDRPDNETDALLRSEQLQTILQLLSETDRDIVIARSLEDTPYCEIAMLYHKPEPTIRKIHSRALQKLSQLFQKNYGLNYRPY